MYANKVDKRAWDRRNYQRYKARRICPQCKTREPKPGRTCCQSCITRMTR